MQVQQVAATLGLNATAPFTVQLPSGRSITAEVLVEDVMYPKGTLFFTFGTPEAEAIWQCREELSKFGYGFTIYDEENDSQVTDELISDFIDMFSEWGWGNLDKPQPPWLCDFDATHPE